MLENVLPHSSAPDWTVKSTTGAQILALTEFLFSLSSQKCHLSLVLELEDISRVYNRHAERKLIFSWTLEILQGEPWLCIQKSDSE